MAYPDSIVYFTQAAYRSPINVDTWNLLQDTISGLESVVGIDSSNVPESVDYRLSQIEQRVAAIDPYEGVYPLALESRPLKGACISLYRYKSSSAGSIVLEKSPGLKDLLSGSISGHYARIAISSMPSPYNTISRVLSARMVFNWDGTWNTIRVVPVVKTNQQLYLYFYQGDSVYDIYNECYNNRHYIWVLYAT
mgnify:CR=1 FL=1